MRVEIISFLIEKTIQKRTKGVEIKCRIQCSNHYNRGKVRDARKIPNNSDEEKMKG